MFLLVVIEGAAFWREISEKFSLFMDEDLKFSQQFDFGFSVN